MQYKGNIGKVRCKIMSVRKPEGTKQEGWGGGRGDTALISD